MDVLEKDAASQGFRLIAGVDEAGRGPLAGPVVAAAVIFPFPPPINPSIKDSKLLSAQRRASLVFDIYRSAIGVGVGFAWPDEIDGINIHNATLCSMERAVKAAGITPDIVLVDGRFTFKSSLRQKPVVSGDTLSVSIAAASIIAKTARDAVMDAYHRIYPSYNFRSHKGYGTQEHLAALRRFGPSPIHRMTFNGVKSE